MSRPRRSNTKSTESTSEVVKEVQALRDSLNETSEGSGVV